MDRNHRVIMRNRSLSGYPSEVFLSVSKAYRRGNPNLISFQNIAT